MPRKKSRPAKGKGSDASDGDPLSSPAPRTPLARSATASPASIGVVSPASALSSAGGTTGGATWIQDGEVDAVVCASGKAVGAVGAAAGWRDVALLVNPRTMERAGLVLASHVALWLRPSPPTTTSPQRRGAGGANAGGDDGKGDYRVASAALNTTDEMDSSQASIVSCFTVWPAQDLKPRQVAFARALPWHPPVGASVVLARVSPRPAASVTVHFEHESKSMNTPSLSQKDTSRTASHQSEDVALATELLRDRCVVVGSALSGTRMGVRVTARVDAAESCEIENSVHSSNESVGDGGTGATSSRGEDYDGRSGGDAHRHFMHNLPAFVVTDQTDIRVVSENLDGNATAGDISANGAKSHQHRNTQTEDAYAAIGGLGPQLEAIRDMIELPLRNPGLFARFGVRPPGGVLLVGPPGTGKTLIARACAAASGAHTIVVNGPGRWPHTELIA